MIVECHDLEEKFSSIDQPSWSAIHKPTELPNLWAHKKTSIIQALTSQVPLKFYFKYICLYLKSSIKTWKYFLRKCFFKILSWAWRVQSELVCRGALYCCELHFWDFELLLFEREWKCHVPKMALESLYPAVCSNAFVVDSEEIN